MPNILDYYEYAKLSSAGYIKLDGKSLDGATVASEANSDVQKRLPRALANQMFDRESDEAKASGQSVWTIPNFGPDRNGYFENKWGRSHLLPARRVTADNN